MISAASPLVDYSSAQTVMAAVDLECVPQDGSSVNIEVYPGATLTGYTTCTVSNPTIHVEKISITTSADGLAVASPGSVTVAALPIGDFATLPIVLPTFLTAFLIPPNIAGSLGTTSMMPPPMYNCLFICPLDIVII